MSTKINNATAVYVIMVTVFAGGLWTILSFGGTLRAAPDLAGEWELTDLSTGEITKATINQSGRFAQFRMAGLPPVECRLKTDASRAVYLNGKDLSLTLEPATQTDSYRLSMTSAATSAENPAPRQFSARLITRTYPRPQAATRPVVGSTSKPS